MSQVAVQKSEQGVERQQPVDRWEVPPAFFLRVQLALVRPIAKISAAYADATDTRMQLLLEALNSCLTMKVLGLEARLTDSLQHLR